MTPTSTRDSLRPGTPSTTPTPHRVSPGSTARTRTAYLPGAWGSGRSEQVFGTTLTGLPRKDGGTPVTACLLVDVRARAPGPSLLVVVELGEHVVGDVAVGVDVLHVVAVLERVDDVEHLLGAVDVQLDLGLGTN